MIDPPILVPTSASVLASNARHLARLNPDLRGLAEELLERRAARGWPMAITQSRRSDRTQSGYFAHGRALENGVWRVVDPALVVTKSPTAAYTAHGCVCRLRNLDDADCICADAFDCAYLIDGRLVGPRPGPGNDSYDAGLPWRDYAADARDLHLVPGASFGESKPGALDGWDKGHVERRGWQARKLMRRAA